MENCLPYLHAQIDLIKPKVIVALGALSRRFVQARYRQRWEPDFPMPEDGYAGDYIRELADELADRDGERWLDVPLEECLEVFRGFAGDAISRGIRADLERFRVEFDVWFNESTLYEDGRLDATLADLKAAGAVYEHEGATWLKASEYGDTEDRVLVKSDGSTTAPVCIAWAATASAQNTMLIQTCS